jgi:TolB-like protein
MSLFSELKRRNVVRVVIAYAVVGWVIAQIAEFAFENFGAPDWVLKTVVVLLLLGLPLALFFAWAFEVTPDGVKREKDVDRSQSITTQTGRKLDRAIIGVLVVALAWFAWDKFSDTAEPMPVSEPRAEAATNSDLPVSSPSELANKSVAVLPFVAMSSGADDEYFADGLTEEILNSLAQLPELLVTARTSAFSFKGQDIPIQEIAAVLGVKHIVEGSVRRSGERLRVTAQLIRAADGFHLWSENYDSSSTDTIAVQENIAEQIAAAMDIVLDEQKREAMRQAGLRDVEAFTLYQKGLKVYNDAHGERDTIEGLLEANEYFEQVIDRVTNFSQVYIDHSDLFIHLLTLEAAENRPAGISDEDITGAYSSAIADYKAAVSNARSTDLRLMIELDLAFLSGNWRGLGGRIDRALAEPGCSEGNWTPIIADIFGYSQPYLEHTYNLLACDPRRSLSWFNTARSALKVGDKVEALRVANEGTQVAPGGWLNTALIRALLANGRVEEARQELGDRIQDEQSALQFSILIAAHEGDRQEVDRLVDMYRELPGMGDFQLLIATAWAGYRDEANDLASKIDRHHFGAVTLAQATQWCGCGSPFDLDSTPNFAAKIKESGLPWSPPVTVGFPLKDW